LFNITLIIQLMIMGQSKVPNYSTNPIGKLRLIFIAGASHHFRRGASNTFYRTPNIRQHGK